MTKVTSLLATLMKKYVEELEKQAILNPVKAKLDAEKALIETGVLNSNGTSKEQIVTGEYL